MAPDWPHDCRRSGFRDSGVKRLDDEGAAGQGLGMVVGLTGNFGSGKSTVLKIFGQLGAKTIDSDQSVAKIYASDDGFKEALRREFGSTVFDAEGGVIRKKLGKLAFSSADKLAWLERELHPRVKRMRQNLINDAPQALWVVEIPLLFEKNLDSETDYSVSVIASYSLRVDRLKSRGFSPEAVAARNSKQLPQAHKISRANFVILNDGSREFLKEQVAHLYGQLQSALA